MSSPFFGDAKLIGFHSRASPRLRGLDRLPNNAFRTPATRTRNEHFPAARFFFNAAAAPWTLEPFQQTFFPRTGRRDVIPDGFGCDLRHGGKCRVGMVQEDATFPADPCSP